MKEVLIQATGSEVLALTESRAASTRLNEEKFMVVLLDFQMPSPDGSSWQRSRGTQA
jgi:DNA-binding response OmpR family regulator